MSLTTCSPPIKTDEETSSALFSAFLVSPHSSELIGGLQMARDYRHQPVLVDQVVRLAAERPQGLALDLTAGGGGHAAALLAAYPGLRVLALDRDPTAVAAATATLKPFKNRALVVHDTFDELATVLAAHDAFVGGEDVVFALMDLGVSSSQLDDGPRGFSYRSDAPADMRMDPTRGVTAAELLATIDVQTLAALLYRHGEGRFAPAIARGVVAARPTTTGQLVAAVEGAVPPAARRRGHVAARVFQALRVEVNNEEGQLRDGLRAAWDALAPGGALAVISYHSGEDRAVKQFLAERRRGGCRCPSGRPCVCGATAGARLLKNSATLSSPAEVAENPRARSARLRAAWKLAA